MRLRNVIIVMLALLVGECVFAFLLWHVKIRAEVKSLRAAAHKAGCPLTLEELQAWYVKPPEGQNAADIYIRAFRDQPALPSPKLIPDLPLLGDATMPLPSEPLSELTVQTIEEFLRDTSEPLRLLHEGAKVEDSRYPIDLTLGEKTELPHLAMLRHGACMLSLESILQAHRGNSEAAVESIIDILPVGRSLCQEPLSISQLVRIAINADAESALEQVLARTDLNEDQLARLDQAFSSSEEETRCFVRGLVGERAMATSFFTLKPSENVKREDGPHEEDGLLSGNALDAFHTVTGFCVYGHCWFLRHMNPLVEAAKRPVEEQPELYDRFQMDIDGASETFNVGKIMFSPLPRALLANGGDLAVFRAIRTAIAIERYRLKQGSLPKQLQDLVPEEMIAVPIDPFSGNPLLYRLRDKGYIVYSIYINREDDGGIDVDEGKKLGLRFDETDIGFDAVR